MSPAFDWTAKTDRVRLERVLKRIVDAAADLEEMGFLYEGNRLREGFRYLQDKLATTS